MAKDPDKSLGDQNTFDGGVKRVESPRFDQEGAETLGCVSYLQQVQSIADGPSWADRQEEILEKTNSPEAIVRQLTTQSRMRN